MKKITGLLIIGLSLVLSCTKESASSVNKIEDLYTVPADAVTMPALSASKSTWSLDRRYFDLSFGGVLSTRLVGYDALLASGQYVLGADEIGNAVLAKTTLNGVAAQEGFITVNSKDGNDTITAQIDGGVFSWTGPLPFVADPAPLALSTVLQAQSNKGNGVNSLTMQLASNSEIHQEFDMQTYQNVWVGEGKYLALDIYSEDGYLHEGSYKACTVGGTINAGEFGIGYDTTMQYGEQVYEMKDWGSCLWTVANGAATAEKILGGVVNVTSREEKVEGKDVTIWTISWGVNYPVEVLFDGAIPALTKPKKPAGPVKPTHTFTEDELQDVTTQQGALVEGVKKHPIHIFDADKNEVAYLELLIAEGDDDYSGSYPSTSYASAAGQMADGWEFDGTAFGMGYMSGGSYYINAAGEKALLGAGTVTVEVTKIAQGAYSFTCPFFDFPAAGPDYVPEEGGDDDVTGDVVLKLTSGLTYTMEDVTSSNTAAGGVALSGVTLWRVTVSDASGKVAAFDLGTDAGSSDLAGSYTVMSYPDAPGKAGNGWGFAAFGMFGGCYFQVDGAYYFIPADATIVVSSNADGTLKIKFEGSIQKDDNSDGGQGGVLLNNIAKS